MHRDGKKDKMYSFQSINEESMVQPRVIVDTCTLCEQCMSMLNCLFSLNSCVSRLIHFYEEKERLKIHVFFLVAAIGEDIFSVLYHKKEKNGDQQVTITIATRR